MRRAVAGFVLAGALVLSAGASAEPINLVVRAPERVPARAKFTVTVHVRANARALDVATAPLRLRVRLAPECDGTFARTVGRTAIDRVLDPAPVADTTYRGTMTGAVRERAYGTYAVCAFLEERGDSRQLATAVDTTVAVTKRCTAKTKTLARRRRRLRHAHGAADRARARRQVRAAKRAVGRACG